MEPLHPTRDGPWDRRRTRREILKLGALLAAGAAVTPIVAACGSSTASASRTAIAATGSLAGPVTVLTGGGDPMAQPALKRVYDDFKARIPRSSGTFARSRAAGPSGTGWRVPR
jgi:hypothetical protein